jgi:cysteine desulfurase/selenocysteine lyase
VATTSPSIAVGYDVEALRQQQFPLTRDTAYLNHAGISPVPRRTYEALRVANECLMLDPSGSFQTYFQERLQAFSETMRALINAAKAVEIVGVQSTSFGLNLVAQALAWQRGQNVVLCDMEFPSNVYPWMRLQEQYGVEVRLVPSQDGGLTLDMLARAADTNTRLVAASAIQFFTGHRTDLTAVGAFCKERNILFVVDAIQAAGHMPIDVQAMHIDVLASGGQKSLMGPPGQGFLYVRRDLVEQMRPTFVGPNAVDDFLHWLKYKLTPLVGAGRFNMGTPNLSGIVGLLDSVTMLRELGLPAVDSYVTALADYAIDQLKSHGYDVITPAAHGPIVTFRAADTDKATDALVEALNAQKIVVVKHWDKQDIAYIRASLHCYNNPSDIDRLVNALKEHKR